jgi:hypothetical protein
MNYDNGTHANWYWDPANQYNWSFAYATYDAQWNQTYELVDYDDGTHGQYYWDPANQYNWSFTYATYDAYWNATHQQVDYDDGTHAILDWDPANQYNWWQIYATYDAAWNLTYEQVNYDDGSVFYYSPPVILDLDGNGVDVTPLSSSTARFDMNGDGLRDATAWVGPKDGFLVIDLAVDGTSGPDGVIDQAKELIFTQWAPGTGSDMAALRQVFDTNHNGKLDAGDARWSEFRVWIDGNEDGISQPGELKTFDQLGITSIGLDPSGPARMISDGSIIQGVSAYTRTDGTTGVAGDVALVYDAGIKAKPGSATADPSGSGFGLRIQVIDAPTAMATDARLNQVAQDTTAAQLPIGAGQDGAPLPDLLQTLRQVDAGSINLGPSDSTPMHSDASSIGVASAAALTFGASDTSAAAPDAKTTDAQLNQLVQALAIHSSDAGGFDLAAMPPPPIDPNQAAVAQALHH